ncbi:hypothetical protein HYFRA_00005992 [Hymenoscyphus fraxineus]|uniref:EthD domain-containing protein n=1 Tax=Hymenoscyphus fraxineus TaxID=746836 RepID=A0A9N9PUB9_9HELO|nr:hypothetical protein HYFRA_00005992 [Hymenoscyphus fraxineus]
MSSATSLISDCASKDTINKANSHLHAHPEPKFVKVTLFIKKLPHITDEFFHNYWRKEHAEGSMFKGSIFAEKVLRYNQVHTSPLLKAQAKELGFPLAEWDGYAEVWLRTLDDWKAIIEDEKFMDFIAADEKHFLEPGYHLMLSYDNLVIGEVRTGLETQVKGKTLVKAKL